MVDIAELKNEIDNNGNKNEKIDNNEILDFLSSEENIKKLSEALDSSENLQLAKEFREAIWISCHKITTSKILGVFTKEKDFKNISLNEFNILLFFCIKWYSSPVINNNDFQEIKKLHQNVLKIVLPRFTNYKHRKYEYDEWLRNAKDKEKYIKQHYKDLGPFPEYYDKIEQKRKEQLEQRFAEHPIEDNAMDILWDNQKQKYEEKYWKQRENDKVKILSIVEKDWDLTNEDKSELIRLRNQYYIFHFAYRNPEIKTDTNGDEDSPNENPFLSIYFPCEEYDKIAKQIEEKLNANDFQLIRNIIKNNKLPNNIKQLSQINERFNKYWLSFRKENNDIEQIIKNEINNISNNILNVDNNKKLTNIQIWIFQLQANVQYWENLTIDGNKWKFPFGKNKNEELTNLYIYRQEIKSRESKKYKNILSIPNLDNILQKLWSNETQNQVFKDFLTFFFNIKESGITFENMLWNENIQKVLTFLINAENYKDITIDDYLKLYDNFRKEQWEWDLTGEEQLRREQLKAELDKYQTMWQYWEEMANKQKESCNERILQLQIEKFCEIYKNIMSWNKSTKEFESLWNQILKNPALKKEQKDEILNMILQVKIKRFYDLYSDIMSWNNKSKKEFESLWNQILKNPALKKEQKDEIQAVILQVKIKRFYDLHSDIRNWNNKLKDEFENLWKQILNSSALKKDQRNEILIMLWSIFSEIEKWESKSIPSWTQSTYRSIKYTTWCKIDIKIDLDERDKKYGPWPYGYLPKIVTIVLDGKELSIWNMKREGYEISIDKNKDLIIKKLWWGWSELKDRFWDKIYKEYQQAQQTLNYKAKVGEKNYDISTQVESKDGIKLTSLSEKDKKIIDDETGYTKRLNYYKTVGSSEARSAARDYDLDSTPPSTPTPPKAPNYNEYHHLNIPGCEWKLVHIKPSERNSIKTAIVNHWNNMCFNPIKKQTWKIYELTLKDLNITKKDKKWNIHLYEINNDWSQWKEIRSISNEDLSEINRTNNLIMTSVQMAPWLQNALTNASNLSDGIKYIQETYAQFADGNLSDSDARNIMIKADSIIDNLNDLCNHHNDFIQLKKWLEQRYSWQSNIDTESEQTIKRIISNLNYLIDATVRWWELQKFCTSMLNERIVHGNDTRQKRTIWRFRNNLIQTILAIGAAVAAICLTPVTWWWSLALLKVSMIMTAWWMVWWFAWQIANEQLQNLCTKTIITESWKKIDVRYDDPTSLELAFNWDISRGDFALETWIQFIIWTATTFWCMTAGQYIGWWLTKAVESWWKWSKAVERITKLNKNFRVANWDPMTQWLFDQLAVNIWKNPETLIKQFWKEFLGEMREEISETWFEELWNWLRKTNPCLAIICSWMATLATARHCLTPWWNMQKVYTENGVSLWTKIWDTDCIGNTLKITLEYDWNLEAIKKYYIDNHYTFVDWHLEMPNADFPGMKNIIYLRKTEVPIATRTLVSRLSWYGISLDTETWKWYYEHMSKIQELELSWAINVSVDSQTKKVTIISWETTIELEQKYFDWKPHKFDVNESQARSNSKMMDDLAKMVNEGNINTETLQNLREDIQKQYKNATWKEIELTDEQLLSIFKAHKEAGVLWNVAPAELKHKDAILTETINDKDFRRFLLEAGFCAKSQLDLRDPISNLQKRQIEYRIKWGEESELTENPEITKAKDAIIETIEQLKKEISTAEWEELQALKNKETVMTAILEKIESARFGLEQLLEWKPIWQLKDWTVVYAETIEQFLELYQLWLNEWKTTIVGENWEKTELKWKKIDEASRMLTLKYYYEAIMKPLWLTIFADPSLTMENVNDNFVDETHSDWFEINESDKLTLKKCETIEEIWSHILDQIAINEWRMEKWEKTWDIKSTVNEEIEKLKDKGKETTESKIARELWASIQKHSEWKISAEDQAYLFAFSMKEMADYRTAYPNMATEQVFTLLNSNQNKLLHQHLRDLNTITSSDHWIKHVMRWNVTLAENIFLQLDTKDENWGTIREKLYEATDDKGRPKNRKDWETIEQFKARWKVLTRQAVIDHDLWYTHVANKAFDEAWFSKWFHMVTDHPLRSTTWIDNNQAFYTILFGENWYNSLIESVPWHSNTQTQNIPKIANWTASQTEFIRWILSCVDCAWSPWDYKIAHMFAQKEMIWWLFSAYSLLDAKNTEWAKQALTNLIETIDAMPDSWELALIKESRKKWIDAFLTNKNFNDMSPEELKDTFWFHFNKFLWAFGVRTEIDPNTGRAKAWINEKGGRSIEFNLAWESFEILSERFWAWVSLKSLIWVCDDYKINDKWPTSKFLEWQTQQSIDKRIAEGKNKPLKEYITESFSVWPTEAEVSKFNDYLKKKAWDKRKESDCVSFKDWKFYTGNKADDASIDFSPDRWIIIKWKNNVEITLNFDGDGYDWFSETAWLFQKMNNELGQRIKIRIKIIEEEKDNPEQLKRETSQIASTLADYWKNLSKENPWLDTSKWKGITDGIAEITDQSEIDILKLTDKINELRSAYSITIQKIQPSNPTLN